MNMDAEKYEYPENEMSDLRKRGGESLLQRVRLLQRALSRALGRHGLSAPMAATLLHMLFEGEPREPAQIADATCIPRQTMTSLLDGLERQGFIVRDNHPTDRRRKLTSLTEPGATLAKEIFKDLMDSEGRVFSVLSRSEFMQFVSLVNRICARIEQMLST